MNHTTALKELATKLLDDYRAGSSFFFASPYRTILAEGTFATVKHSQAENVPELVRAVLSNAKQAGHPNPIVVGALPFDRTKSVQLVVPRESRLADRLQFDFTDRIQQSPALTYEMNPIPSSSEYMRGVEQGVAKIKSGDLKKIVLSRSLDLKSPEKVDIQKLLCDLAQHNKQGYTFAVDLPKSEEIENCDASPKRSHTLIGASPELLVSRSGMQIISNPLAGSRPRSKDPEEDKRRADELLSSAKDLHEHAVVVEAVAAALRPYCRTLHVPEKPSLINSEAMWHLSTEVKGELLDASVSALELALALHPTPAVCGTPTEKAREAINEIEPFDREFFTGMLGWSDLNGDGEWIVTIRCAEVEGNSLRLFAGAGIVAESKPEDELAETSAKFRTMLRAMGLNDESLK
ncbi:MULTISPECIES: isochorismate synthase DhbC [Bacillus]|uniref:isochorismate synthase n=1 Tax=Bacillus pseudomycoides TaxID=64104 RepID=A0AAJ3V4N2_9BACI|nr:isochorismate synthase DhbC [Bacillus pseudomycoides]EEM05503.1 Isochorismate synthase [Bacillus pseudomycoides]EEM11238.1 Isochorismate synthase [Bacillus pseudomycoides]KFN15752.1 isochorismate synthase dhbC [Bacillus pseudomycoides]MBD5800589.1 isochorismate synthase [Bacillus pseudomycoides]MCR8859409.1 isochorismate synthase DhbC [Bacillus pseudomycoides]